MTTTTAPTAISPSTFDLRRVLRVGGLAGLVMVFVSANGMLQAFNGRLIINPILSLGYALLFAIPLVAGRQFTRRKHIEGIETAPRTGADVMAGLIAGLLAGGIVALFTVLVDAFPGMRSVFPKLSSVLVQLLTLDQGLGTGALIVVVGAGVAGLIGAGLGMLPERTRKALLIGIETLVILAVFQAVVNDLFSWFRTLPNFLYAPRGGLTVTAAIVVFVVAVALGLYLPGRVKGVREMVADPDPKRKTRKTLILAGIVFLIVMILPQFLGGIINELLTNVGLFLLMALGLNIVVGSAGLLDLGYVAFFAVGAYTTAVLTSPLSPFFNPELSWWMAFPVVLIAAAIAGLLVGTPVLRMRGDYLAIVTLGFGEIVRLVLLSDWLSPYFGGAQGIRRIPGIPLPGEGNFINATTPDLFIYAILFFVAVSAYISWRLQDSRVGRAWAAMREDEDVAEAVGVDTVRAKLLAFVTGAVLASFAGALFSAKVGSVFTNSFEIIVSIIILVIVIVGGMGNIAGVAVGALLLIGVLGGPNQPGLLQEFGEFKLLIYGALLVFMMLNKPEGLIPSARRAQELHQEEFLQDAWLDKGGELAKTGEEA